MLNGYTPEQAFDALLTIPPTIDHDTRAKVGMGAKDAGVTFDDYDAWQSTNPRYDAGEVRSMWHSFTDGPVKAGTLFSIAKEHGWTPNGTASPYKAPSKPARPPEPPRKPAAGMGASEVYDRCQPATAAHGYVVKKQGTPDGCRVVPDGDKLTIAGQSMAGYLAVPAYAPDGEIQSLQFIPPNGGKKLNLPGASMAGGSFTLGTDGPVYLCEGIGATWSAWQSTGHRAVCCFGWGNVKAIAAQLSQREPDAKLLICPDVGKEVAAAEIAALHHCAVAKMPEGWPDNSDLNDLFCSPDAGFDVVQALLEAATELKPEPKVHPLARFVDIDGTAKPPRWVIPGFIGHGVTVIAGAHGVGKTTALLPLALTAAGLHGAELLPRQWRHVVYVTEDVEQARRILAGIVGFSNLAINLEAVRERVHIVEAVRLDPAFVAQVGTTYREQFTRTVEGVEVLPLVVLDTKSAVLAIENENDNSEASSMMAALKQGFDRLPVWLIGHVAKANLSRNDALTSRGASAIEGDANQTMFLIREGESRYLVQGKTRFEARWPELEITSYTAQTVEPDEFGNLETVLLRWGIAAPAQQSRKEAAEQAAEQQRKEDEASLRQDIRDAVEVAWQTGNPLNRAGVMAKLTRKRQTVSAMIENLLSEQWLFEVAVPAKVRTMNCKSAFLVNLTTEEHDAVLAGDGLPADKLVIPASWQKQAVSPVPAPEGEVVVVDHE